MIYVDWAFTENGHEKSRSNYEKYLEIKDQATATLVSDGYSCKTYRVDVKDGYNLTDNEKALIADRGNLCFGYNKINDKLYEIYVD